MNHNTTTDHIMSCPFYRNKPCDNFNCAFFCTYAHTEGELNIRICLNDVFCKNKDTCTYKHSYETKEDYIKKNKFDLIFREIAEKNQRYGGVCMDSDETSKYSYRLTSHYFFENMADILEKCDKSYTIFIED